jgi:hypothetical protein
MTGAAKRDGHLPGAFGIAANAFFDSVLKDVAGANTCGHSNRLCRGRARMTLSPLS